MNIKTREKLKSNLFLLKILYFSVFAILLFTLFKMQVLDAQIYKTRADSNRMRLVGIQAPRGDIITNDGVVLVRDYPSFEISLTYMDVVGAQESLEALVEILNDPKITTEWLNEKIAENKFRSYEPIIIKRGLSIEEVSRIEARKSELPGVRITESPIRTQLYPGVASHLIGFISEISSELGQPGYENYRLGDLIGKFGVEKGYETYLRGSDGYQKVEVNAKNRPISFLDTKEAVAGNNIVLTIDFKLQKLLDESFDELLETLQKNPRTAYAEQGAIVMMEVKTGRILAMSSRPNDPVRYQNKVIQGRYIPGSTYKMITGLAALEYAKINPQEIIVNRGAYWEPPYIKSIAPLGPYNYYSAIAQSDNVYFQEMGRRAGIENISKMGEEFGLHLPTGIDLPYESSGDSVFQGLPNAEKRAAYFKWAEGVTNNRYEKRMADLELEYEEKMAAASSDEDIKKVQREKTRDLNILKAQWQIDLKWNTSWHAADTFNVAIGQGRQNFTPIQLASYVAQLANDGVRMRPYVVEKIVSEDGLVIEEFFPQVAGTTNISKDSMEKTIRGMVQASEPRGTAYSLFANFPSNIKVAAKTGTAQREINIETIDAKGEKVVTKVFQSDGLFTAFAPANDPEVVFFGIVEAGNSGSGSAGRIAKILFEEYFGIGKAGE
jgi:penicillin-binding protein 2